MVCILLISCEFKFQSNFSMKLLIPCFILVNSFAFTFANCPKLSPPIGGVFVKECTNTVESICVIKCTIDKSIHKRKCLEDGTWTGGIIQCHRRIRCRKTLSTPLNGYIIGSCKRRIGTICTFACNSGFKLSGAQQVICEVKGEWSSPEPKCLPLATCPQLPIPNFGARNGICHKDSPVNASCFFSCNEDFTLEGSKTLLCTANGRWNASVPICKRNPTPPPKPNLIPCPGLTPIQYGTQMGYCNPGYPGKECTFNCSEGYYLVGNPVLKCGYEGEWTAAAPICIRGEGCVPPIPNKGVVITRCKSFLGGKCYYICINDGGLLNSLYQNYTTFNPFARSFSFDFAENKEKYTVCGPDGQWQSQMGCKKIKLPKFPLLSLLGK